MDHEKTLKKAKSAEGKFHSAQKLDDDIAQKESKASPSQFEPSSGKPLYEQAIAWLLQKIESGEWPIHHQLPPEVTLAEQLQVSRVTMRRALGDLTKKGYFIRIAGRGTFVALAHHPETENTPQAMHSIQRLHSLEAHIIGVLVPSTASAFVSTILAHLEHALYKRGYRMLLANSRDSLKLQDEHLQQFVDMGVAGIVLYSGSFLHDETINTLLNQHIPLVMIDRYYPAITTHVVMTDHFRSGYVMTEHLLRQGHRRIGFILATTEMVTSTLARFEGYKGALQDYGIEFDERFLMKAQIHKETVQTYLKRAGELDAVFACNDERALEFYAALRSLNLQVPKDLALVGCDDIPVVSQLDPPLTTIAQNVHQLGESTAQLLTETIEGRITSPQTILIPPELVVRQSSQMFSQNNGVVPLSNDENFNYLQSQKQTYQS